MLAIYPILELLMGLFWNRMGRHHKDFQLGAKGIFEREALGNDRRWWRRRLWSFCPCRFDGLNFALPIWIMFLFCWTSNLNTRFWAALNLPCLKTFLGISDTAYLSQLRLGSFGLWLFRQRQNEYDLDLNRWLCPSPLSTQSTPNWHLISFSRSFPFFLAWIILIN